MPAVSLPILAIKEANDHLQALFNENQSLDTQLDEHKTLLAEKEEDNKKYSAQVNSLNNQVSSLMEQLDELKIGHRKEICTLRESLNSEHEEAIKVVADRHSEEISLVKDVHEKEINKLKESMESDFDLKLSEQEEFYKQEIEDTVTKETQLAKIDKQKSLHDLEVTLKHEEKEKIDVLQEIIESHQNEIKSLHVEIDRLTNCLLLNTKKREKKIEILSKVFKSTVENMSLCLEIVNEGEFISTCNFIGNNLNKELDMKLNGNMEVGDSTSEVTSHNNDNLALHDSGLVIDDFESSSTGTGQQSVNINEAVGAEDYSNSSKVSSLCNGFHSESYLQ